MATEQEWEPLGINTAAYIDLAGGILNNGGRRSLIFRIPIVSKDAIIPVDDCRDFLGAVVRKKGSRGEENVCVTATKNAIFHDDCWRTKEELANTYEYRWPGDIGWLHCGVTTLNK